MKETISELTKMSYSTPEALPFSVEPVKCFATSDPKTYTGEEWGDDFEEDNN